MGRLNGFGVGQQGYHPRARGSLSSVSGARPHRKQFWGFMNPEVTSHYFVPSFSIRRHLHQSEEAYWMGTSKQIGGMLGHHFDVMLPKDVTVKTIEQKALIHKLRDSGEQPSSDAMRDLVFSIRDGLTNYLADSPDPLEFGLGKLAVFGRNRNKLAFTLDGWKGWRARYDDFDEMGKMSALGALLVESQVAVGNIGMAFPDMNFAVNDIAVSPHMTIARTKDTIRDHELRRIQSQINELGIDSVTLGDPVIGYKLAPQEESHIIPIRHAWESLAQMPEYTENAVIDFEIEPYQVA